MRHLSAKKLPFEGLIEITRCHLGDNRGFLSRVFCADELSEFGWNKTVAQMNHTYTATQGSIRGMHFQLPPHAEMKLVSCLKGEVWDVIVDLRQDSETYGQWHAVRLSAEKKNAVLIPEGCAHGFQTLTDDVELIYCHSEAYYPDSERGLNPFDPALAIEWPLTVTEISSRDNSRPLIDKDFKGVVL